MSEEVIARTAVQHCRRSETRRKAKRYGSGLSESDEMGKACFHQPLLHEQFVSNPELAPRRDHAYRNGNAPCCSGEPLPD